jgi:uncharacterized protein (TIGR03083 family)
MTNLSPFDIFDTEAARLDRFFSSLDAAGWERPTRCAGWSVRDVLGHLAGEELYNHACLNGTIGELAEILALENVDINEFNDWCVRQRRGVPVEEVLVEWRTKNGETRRRMRELGAEATLETASGPYPVGGQTLHYDSEYATHADDIGVPVTPDEAAGRTAWRVEVGLFALAEADSTVDAEELLAGGLSAEDFVAATVGRLPDGHPLDPELAKALRCLA